MKMSNYSQSSLKTLSPLDLLYNNTTLWQTYQ